ncbi:hypothetical protein [Acidovorax sp. SUPP3334]|uniref:hypothetical protein n=1 Tax=Acidovorax sp. SUPP3334 TaxID=2920881 RepID=UPI0023DE516E|nr:hypothetical protein [Acidovorax sp. SUPP3334]GKT23355.1 hypothetical protein AVHM3334_11335 [Acidovorax sp. SUPP3334]
MRTTPHGPAHSVPRRPASTRRTGWAWRTGVWAAVGAVLLGTVFLLYAEPDFMVMMADQMWACF